MLGAKLGKLKKGDVLFYSSGAVAGGIFAAAALLLAGRLPAFLAEIVYVVSGVIAFLPFLIKWYAKFNKRKKIELFFPVFLRDFIETVRSGMTLTQAFKSVSNNDYGALSAYVKKMSAQLDWGIPIDKVLLNFSKEARSNLIGRVVSTVIESHNFGGNLIDTFDVLSKTTAEVDKLRKERVLYLQSQLITGYIVFFIFLAVIIGLQLFLTPSLTSFPQGTLGPAGLQSSMPPEKLAEQYNDVYKNLILIQGLFAGLAVGKMSEGSVISGIKHSLFMMLVGFVTFTFVLGNPQLVPVPV